MKTFYKLLVNALLVATKNNFVWFALTYWVYLETRSVVSTGVVGGLFLVANAVSAFWFGSLVDNYKKKNVMLGSSIATLVLFTVGFFLYTATPLEVFKDITSPNLWLFAVTLLAGAVAGSIFQIAIPTLISVLVPKTKLDRANGMFGTVFGFSFALTSVASGLVLGFWGMYWVLIVAILASLIAIAHLSTIDIPEKKVAKVQEKTVTHGLHEANVKNGIDIAGTIKAVKIIPGLFALIFLTTFNNLLGGVFMALMDAYGLTLVSVQTWGLLWGFLSFGFIFGGLYISKYGLGNSPLKRLFRIYLVIWGVCIIFPIQPSIVLLTMGALTWMSFFPFIEATEQTIIQKVVPVERQGRVFGFAHSIEQAASPLTAFLIGPTAQFVFIPFMTTGAGVNLIGDWFGVGEGRGIALVFMTAGAVGLVATLFAMRARPYKLLAKRYLQA